MGDIIIENMDKLIKKKKKIIKPKKCESCGQELEHNTCWNGGCEKHGYPF